MPARPRLLPLTNATRPPWPPAAQLRQLLRHVPGAQRAEVLAVVRTASSESGASALPELGRELLFHLESQRYQRELNERYFPASELTDREKIHRMARIVGLEAPPHVPLEPPPDRPLPARPSTPQ